MCPPRTVSTADLFAELMMDPRMQEELQRIGREADERHAAAVAAFPVAREDTIALAAELRA